MDSQRVKRVGQYARHDRAVLQRVADAGWRLRACADHAPLAIHVACEIESHQVQKGAVGGTDAVARAQEPGMPEDERRGEQTAAEQLLWAVDVRGDGVEQPRALPE